MLRVWEVDITETYVIILPNTSWQAVWNGRLGTAHKSGKGSKLSSHICTWVLGWKSVLPILNWETQGRIWFGNKQADCLNVFQRDHGLDREDHCFLGWWW